VKSKLLILRQNKTTLMLSELKNYLILFLKGIGMGAANVIPGVSGGTIALITRIFERLINSIKSSNSTYDNRK